MNRRQTLLIAKYSTRYSVRGGIGLIFLLLSLTFGLVVAHTMLQPVEMAVKEITKDNPEADKQEITELVLDEMVTFAKPVVSWMVSDSNDADDVDAKRSADDWAGYLLEEQPAVLSAIFLILLFGWPFLIAFGAFDIYAGDIGSRQLRYQLLRVDRGSIFMGRLLGILTTFALVLMLLGLTVVVYMGAKLPMYTWGSLFSWAAQGVAAILWVSLPYVALCAWVSASFGSSFGSLTICSLIIGGVPLFATIGKLTHDAAGYLLYVLPWGFQTKLLHHDWSQVALAGGLCLGQAALFTWLGYRKFTRRDL
ncbi:MAG: hypothetical protein NXI31_23435 [bacterium]|nr:hypothetical protein [bacterium]